MRRCLRWPVFYQLSEIYTAPLNLVWFIFAGALAYQQYHLLNIVNVILCCLCVFLFDLAVNIADNYFDYLHGRDEHFLRHTNPLGRLNLPTNGVRNLVILSYAISAIPGLILVARTGWQVLMLGIIGYAVGIFYTAGPHPLNSTPLCEAIVASFIACFIVLVGIDVAIWGRATMSPLFIGQTILRCLPLVLIFYGLQLSNNLCDRDEDLVNGRKTLAGYIGKRKSLQIVRAVTYLGTVWPVLLVVFGIAPWPVLLCVLCLPALLPKFRQFFINPGKHTTYLPFVKHTSQFIVVYIALYTISVALQVG